MNALKAEEILELRRRLQQITDTYIDDRGHEQIVLIQVLALEYPHQISLIQEAISGHPETGGFTCFQYAFDLVVLPFSVRCITRNFDKKIFINSEYVAWLLTHELTPVTNDATRDGDVILYQRENNIAHAGILRDDLVNSKWGLGHLWSHDILEVPETFGNPAGFFRPISRAAAVEAFIAFAKDCVGVDAVEKILT